MEFLLSALSGVPERPFSLELSFEDDTTEIVDGRAGIGLGDRKENDVGVDERNLLLARSLLPSLIGVAFVLGIEGIALLPLLRLISGVRARELERPCLLLATEFGRLLSALLATELERLLPVGEH